MKRDIWIRERGKEKNNKRKNGGKREIDAWEKREKGDYRMRERGERKRVINERKEKGMD